MLGIAPVEADGSVCFYLKSYVPVYFQSLDERGMAVQSMRTDVYAAPRENISCVEYNSDFYGTYESIDAQRRGEVVQPLME